MAGTHPFKPGVQVVHPQHGLGVVTHEGDDYIGIHFEEMGEALLKLEASGLRLAPLEGVTDLPLVRPPVELVDEPPRNWPESTFAFEVAETDSHSMGSHWSPFYDDPQQIVEQIPHILEQALPQSGYGEAFPALRQQPSEWADGWVMSWPYRNRGVATVIRKGRDVNEFASIFPFHDSGAQITLTLDRVIVWENGVEAQIEATIGPARVCFYDRSFVINRLHYEAGRPYDFVLTGIAYRAAIPEPREITVRQNPEVLAWLNRNADGEDSAAYQPEMKLSIGDMAMLMPIDEWDRDDYHFSGPVNAVETVDDMLGQQAWLVDVTVIRDLEADEPDIDITVLITERSWDETEPPTVGQTISGALWLQGRLWSNSPQAKTAGPG